jgi:hypothetical protein
LHKLFQRICPHLKPCGTFHNMFFFCEEELLVSSLPKCKLQDNTLLPVFDCLFCIFTVTHHIWQHH